MQPHYIVCLYCRKPFEITKPCQLIRKFCSITCSRRHDGERRQTSIASRFWSKVIKGPNCWRWSGAKKDGYGRIGDKRTKSTLYAHRISWEIHFGPIPDGLNVLHDCDNPECSNPEHLFLGTDGDNVRDKVAKKRHSYGETHGAAILTEKDVLDIRRLRAAGVSLGYLARKHGISPQTVWCVVRRLSWKHIK